MSIYRLSRVGFQMSRHLSRGKSSFMNRRIECLERPHRRLLQPLVNSHFKKNVSERCSETRSSQHAMLENSCYFCTTATESTHQERKEQKEKISVTFVDKDGEETQIKVPIGMSMLEAAHEYEIELEGACEGSLACSTCHVVVMDMEYYKKLEEPTDEENDMLDLAFGLTETSRLGCQVIARPELDGIRLALPAATRNFAVDGFVPKPH